MTVITWVMLSRSLFGKAAADRVASKQSKRCVWRICCVATVGLILGARPFRHPTWVNISSSRKLRGASAARPVLQRVSSEDVMDWSLIDFKEPLIVENLAGTECEAEFWLPSTFASKWADVEVTLTDSLMTSIFGPDFVRDLGIGMSRLSLGAFINGIKKRSELRHLFTSTSANPELLKLMTERIPMPSWDVLGQGAYGQVFSLGPDGSGLPLHTHGFSWLTQMHGCKRFFLLRADTNLTALPEDAYREGFITSPARWSEASRAAIVDHGEEVVLSPGEAIIIPAFWYHATENVGTSVAVGGQLFGHTLKSTWTEDDENRRYGPTESARSVMNLGLIRFSLARFLFDDGQREAGHESMEKALAHFARSRELHPLNWYVALKEMLESARWSRTVEGHQHAAAGLRSLVEDLESTRRDGMLQDSIAACAIAYSVVKYAQVYFDRGTQFMIVPLDELKATLSRAMDMMERSSSTVHAESIGGQANTEEFMSASMGFLKEFESVRRIFNTPWP